MADDVEQSSDEGPPDLQAYVNADVKTKSEAWGLGGEMPWFINNGLKLVGAGFGFLVKIYVRLISPVAAALVEGLGTTNDDVGKLAATCLGVVFGQEVAGAIGNIDVGGGGATGNTAAVGAAVLDAVFGSMSLDGGAELTPSVERAEGFLGSVAEIVTRGMVMDIITETFPHFKFEFIQHFEQDLISGLGLGRIARQVLHPVVHTLVAMPAEWAINLAYRPKLHGAPDAIRLWELGTLGDGELDDELGRQGYSSDRIEGLKDLHLKPADFGALTTLLDHDIVSEDDVVNALLHDGFLHTAAAVKVQAHRLARVEPWLVKQADVWLAKYEGGLIDKGTFIESVRATGLPADIQQLIVNVGGARRETATKLLSVGELMIAWDLNILTQNQVHDYLVRLGYNDDDATTLLLTKLAKGQRAEEIEQARTAAAAARAAAQQLAKTERENALAAKRADAAAEKLAKERAAAAAKAQALRDEETRREFITAAAARRRELVDAQQAAANISKDQADALRADIAANEAALLAAATVQAKQADVTFDQQILDLRFSAQMDDYDNQLDEIDVSLEADKPARAAAVAARLATVDQLLALALGDVDDLFAQRATNAADDLTAALAAVDVAILPTRSEREANAAIKTQEVEDTLTRKLADIATHYEELHASVETELAEKTITDKAAANSHQRLADAQTQAERLARQQRDVSVQRLQDIAAAAETLDAVKAEQTKATIQLNADKAARQLATDKLRAEQAAQHTADAERIRLQAIDAQTAPLTAAAAERKRAAIRAAIAKLEASKAVQAAAIQKTAADAAAAATKAQTAVDAARQRVQLLTSTSAQRETAAAAAAAALEAFDAETAAQRDAIEQTILDHRIGTLPA